LLGLEYQRREIKSIVSSNMRNQDYEGDSQLP